MEAHAVKRERSQHWARVGRPPHAFPYGQRSMNYVESHHVDEDHTRQNAIEDDEGR